MARDIQPGMEGHLHPRLFCRCCNALSTSPTTMNLLRLNVKTNPYTIPETAARNTFRKMMIKALVQ